MEFFSTVGLPVHRKMSYWSEISSQTFSDLQIVPRDRERFEGRLSRERAGQLALAEVCSSAGSVHHTEAHVARAVDQRYVLVIPLIGGFQVLHGRQPGFDLQAGEFCLLDESRPYRLTHDRVSRTFCVVLADPLLSDFIPDPAALAGVHMRPLNSMSRMLVSLLQSLSQELQRNGPRVATPAFARSLASFIAAAYSEVVAVDATPVLESRKRCIKRYVDDQLRDPHLRAERIARHFGISQRYLRLIFESDPETLSEYILRRRLENSARLLRDPQWRGQTITTLAFRNGFNNATHFGYVFKRRFGVTPRDYRRATV